MFNIVTGTKHKHHLDAISGYDVNIYGCRCCYNIVLKLKDAVPDI